MSEAIHQTYRDILEEIHTENKKELVHPFYTPHSWEHALYFPRASSLERRSSALIGALVGLLLGLGAAGVGYAVYPKKVAISPASSAAIAVELPHRKSMEAEMDLMKKILVGLVESVETLSKENRTLKSETIPALSQTFPYPVEVITEKANLRRGASRVDAPISTITKGAVLLATEENDGWLKVSTPKGEQAWISKDIVVVKEE